MDTDTTHDDLNEKLQERLKVLPKVVQDAITSADVQKRLRELADTSRLHLDQWQVLENDVMLTLLGFQETADLAENLRADLEIPEELAKKLADDISRIVFAPIRGELESQLEHPDAQAATVSDTDAVRIEMLDHETAAATTPTEVPIPPTVVPATPPTPPPTEKAVRAEPSPSYTPQAPSHERKTIAGDPYREQVE